ncbi:autophagy-related protein 16 isoform X2 [Episyrphus balteatus]|uniref:autophagy-related protein 16 isoform X2 n=1 Tax=Episyrphus balteatus TaxID=286459 RepID=UPI002486C3F6|nr:autophagy-related protein 16 isoform X2 [Episyrphus balteatus]
MSSEAPNWRQSIITRIIDRNKRESSYHRELIQQNNRFYDTVVQLEAENLRIQVENEKLRTAVATGGKDSGGSFAVLERLLAEQKHLTELHKRKGDNSQMIVDLSMKVEEQRKIIAEKELNCAEHMKMNQILRAESAMLKSSLEELKKLDTTLRDEHTALQLAFSALEEKMRGIQDENRSLLERLMKYKSKDADKLNEENESFLKLPSIFRKRSDKLRRDLEDAVRETRNSNSPNDLPPESASIGGGDLGGGGDFLYDEMLMLADEVNLSPGTGPERFHSSEPELIMKFEAHETEASAVRWNPVEKMVATGGADRRVKLWDVNKHITGTTTEARAVLGGSSAGINSVEFDSTGSYILGTSNDFGARLWTVADHRLRVKWTKTKKKVFKIFGGTVNNYDPAKAKKKTRWATHTLTGHSGKVMAAKYVQEPHKVVTGSHDRTLKIWDLRSIACIETKFAGSSCNDLVTSDSLGSTIISGHWDKKIRFWDIRTEKQCVDLAMPAKITSLDLSKDCLYLICSVRDDTIKLIDLRKNQVIGCFSNESFKLSCDWSRAAFNYNATKVACGSSDGTIFVWNVASKESYTLKGHNSGLAYSLIHSCAVIAVAWSPTGSELASVGKSRRCIIWNDA